MRKLFLVFSSLFCLMALSQETYVYKGNGNVLNNKGEVVSPAEMRSLLFDNAKALELYNAGRSKKTVGNILLYGSAVPLTIFMIDFIRGHNGEIVGYQNIGYGYSFPIYGKISMIPAIIGGAMIITAIPVKIGFSKKIKQAVALMNNPAPKQTSFIQESSIIINQNGVGIALKF